MLLSDAGSSSATQSAGAQAYADTEHRPAPPPVHESSPGAALEPANPGTSLRDMAQDGRSESVLAAAQRNQPPAALNPSGVDGYSVGPPKKPEFKWDEDFKYNSQSASFSDYTSAAEWKAKLAGAEVLRPDLADATRAYSHYWDNNGASLEIDYAKGYRDDASIRNNVDGEVARTATAVDTMARSSGDGTFSVTGPGRGSAQYPQTENWQKTIGAYQQWSSADVTVKGNQVTMTVKVHAEDHYNFNRGQSDIASGAPDNGNGRFTELGWAKPFDTHGEVTKTVTWTLGNPPSSADAAKVGIDR
jgi:hypothetical protein